MVLSFFNATKRHFVVSNDRYVLASCMRILSKFCVSESNHLLFSCDYIALQGVDAAEVICNSHVVRKMFTLMYSWDEEIVLTVLELLYWWSNIYDYAMKSSNVELFAYDDSLQERYQCDVPYILVKWASAPELDGSKHYCIGGNGHAVIRVLMKFLTWRSKQPSLKRTSQSLII